MSKSKLFLILASALLISCANPNPNDPNNGNDTGTGGGLTSNPSWFLTAEQQAQDYFITKTIWSKDAANKYRIPAIIAADNGDIIAFADNRYKHGGDIGNTGQNSIDIVYKISKDGGNNWSEEATLLPLSKPGVNEDNKGDPVVFKTLDGEIVVLAVAGGAWFSAPGVPSVIVMTKSTDNGKTWSGWKKVGEESLWKAGPFADGTLQRKAFTASGKGLTLKSGRLMAAMLVGFKSGGQGIVSIYSDDKGETWQPGGLVESSGRNGTLNEPKVIAELNDGTIVMSVRNAAGNGNSTAKRLYAYSKDGGMNWQDATGKSKTLSGWDNMHDADVNAEGVVWTRAGVQDKNRIIHILADGPKRRVGLGLYLSTDEAKTFNQIKKLRQDTQEAVYSCINVLPDGTIITLSEEDQKDGGYDLVFRRYNMKYLTGEIYNAEWYKDWYKTAKNR